MKLRNKRTGEITDVEIQSNCMLVTYQDGRIEQYYFDSIKDLLEWEDYEEPKTFWAISWAGEPEEYDAKNTPEELKNMAKQIGNYFETKEEAEKAVRKLQAWKRLKDGGFVFCGKGDCLDTIKFDYGEAGYNNQDFNLLFGGEE